MQLPTCQSNSSEGKASNSTKRARIHFKKLRGAWKGRSRYLPFGAIDGECNLFRGLSFFIQAQNSKKDPRVVYNKARDAFGKSRIQNPERPHAYLYQAAIDHLEGHPTMAEDHLRQCLEASATGERSK